MMKNERNRFRAALTARIAELERLIRRRDCIKVQRSADQLEEIQQASELQRFGNARMCNLGIVKPVWKDVPREDIAKLWNDSTTL